MHPRYKTKYRVGNWPAYDRALVQRGDVTLWLTPEAIATWEAVGVGTRGGQLQYSEVAIETALTLRLIFHLPLRQTEGFLTSIFGMLCLDLSAPDHTTLSRRGQHLDLALRRLPAGAGIHRIVDSTGLSTVGEGEWAAVKHGGRGIRGWKKLHLGVDGSGVIVAHALTGGHVDDATTALDLIDKVEGNVSNGVLSRLSRASLTRLLIMCSSYACWIGILTFDSCFPDSVVGFQPGRTVTTEYVQTAVDLMQKQLQENAPRAAQRNINLNVLRGVNIPAISGFPKEHKYPISLYFTG